MLGSHSVHLSETLGGILVRPMSTGGSEGESGFFFGICSCVTLAKSLNFSEPQSHHPNNECLGPDVQVYSSPEKDLLVPSAGIPILEREPFSGDIGTPSLCRQK